MERYCSAAIAGVRHREKSVRDSVVNAMRAGRLEWKSPEALGCFSKWSRSVFSVPRMASLCRLKVAFSAFLCGLNRFISTRNPGGWIFVDKLRRSNAVRVGVSLRKLLRADGGAEYLSRRQGCALGASGELGLIAFLSFVPRVKRSWRGTRRALFTSR